MLLFIHIILQSLGMLHLTGQLTGKPVKVDILPVYRWSSKSCQFSALVEVPLTLTPDGPVNQCKHAEKTINNKGGGAASDALYRELEEGESQIILAKTDELFFIR